MLRKLFKINKKSIGAYSIVFLLFLLVFNIFNQSFITFAAEVINNKIDGTNFYINNILGRYIIKPDFKTKISYSFEDYSNIRLQLNEIMNCATENEIEACVAKANNENYEWSLDCSQSKKRVFYEHAKFYQSCLESSDNDCICNYKLEKSQEEIKKYLLSENFNLRMKETNDRKSIEMEMFVKPENLHYYINKENFYGWVPDSFNVHYNEMGLKDATLEFSEQISGKRYTISGQKELNLYKYKDKDIDKIDFVNIVRKPDIGNSLNKVSKIHMLSNNNLIKETEIKMCILKESNIQKFCVKNKKYLLKVYEDESSRFQYKNPVIMFSAYIQDFPPVQIKNLQVFDRPKDSNSIILKWEKSQEKDIQGYMVYYADSDLHIFKEKKLINDIKKDENVFKKYFKAGEALSLNGFFLIPLDCFYDFDGKKCLFTTSIGRAENGIAIPYDVLIFFKDEENYYASIKVPENKRYDFIVTAIDEKNNELDEIAYGMSKSQESYDDLAPSAKGLISLSDSDISYEPKTSEITFTVTKNPKEIQNIDSTKADDFLEYRIYYKKYPEEKFGTDVNSFAKKNEELESLKNSILSDFNYLESFQFAQKVKISLKESVPKPSDTYYFVAIANDKNQNPSKTQYTLKELSAEPFYYIIP